MKIHKNICSIIVFTSILLVSYFNCLNPQPTIDMQIQSKNDKVNQQIAYELSITQKILHMKEHGTYEQLEKYKQQWKQKYRKWNQRIQNIKKRKKITKEKQQAFKNNLKIRQKQPKQITRSSTSKLQLVSIQQVNKRLVQLKRCQKSIQFTQNFYNQVMEEFIEQLETIKRDPLLVSNQDFPFRFSKNQTLRNMYRPSEQFVRQYYAVYKEEENVQ